MNSVAHELLNIGSSDRIPPEITLWRTVIITAFLDATRQSYPTNSKIITCDKKTAIAWFTHRNKDFAMVCDMAHLNPSWIQEKAVKEFQRRGLV